MTKATTAAAQPGPELSARSIVVGLVVAVIIGSAYPYCVLKLGFGPNLSVVSAFLGFMTLVPLSLILRIARTRTRAKTTSCKPWARAPDKLLSCACCSPPSTC